MVIEINKLLKRYRENGTHKSEAKANRLLKLSSVGRFTQKRGGNMNISSIGFKDCNSIYNSGTNMTTPTRHRNKITIKLPALERLSLFFE